MDFFDTKHRQRIKQLESENASLTKKYNNLAESYNDLTKSYHELLQDYVDVKLARAPRVKLSDLGDEFCCLVEDVIKTQMLREFFASQVISADVKRILKAAAHEAREKYFTALSEHNKKTK